MATLKFSSLRSANLMRLPQFKNSKGELAHSEPDGSDWSISDWVEAVLGELGEFANIHKKFRRGDINEIEFRKLGGKEIADIQIYLDILAFRCGLNLGEITIDKFNEVSDRIGCQIKLIDE